ncbi:transposase-like protein [Colletotrichum sojae]|uniref:Transposase-like protein n=1 Tax=Colletotrichum sojae TaxID=2175907 RepID=A0A8H6ILN8_9PEZI|nr:transposase-like protein [Colletotrichum sojae]
MSTIAVASSSANAYAVLGAPRLRISTQIEMALTVRIPPNPTINDLYHIVVGSKRYVLEQQLARLKGRGRSSWIRDHGDFLVEVIQGQAGPSFWSCRRCDSKGSPRVFGAAATTAAQEHLVRAHRICKISTLSDEDSDANTQPSSSDPSTPPPYKRVRLNNSNIPKAKITTLRDLCPSQTRSGRPRRCRYNHQALPDHVREDWASPASRAASRFDSLDEKWQSFLRSSIEQSWQKLFYYYDKLGESPLFSGAIILHPSYGISYLRDIWSDDHQEGWVDKAQKSLTEYYDKWYRQNGPEESISGHEGQPGGLAVDSGARDDDDSHFRQWVNSRRRQTPHRTDELDLYLRQPPEETSEPLRWWLDHSDTFPTLSRLAIDILAVPTMAADCERAFSTAKLTLTSQRMSMKPETIESLQLSKNWLKRGVMLQNNGFGLLS